jgi:two-component system chemotaxis response regulator CheB
MAGRDIIVVGASAGGIEALTELVGGLPADLPAAVFVVVHTAPYGPSRLPALLTRHGSLRAAHAAHGEPIRPGRIYVAPPNRHLVVRPGAVELSQGPREHRVRPAIDVLFRSAARAYGPRVIGVVLSGMLDDGSMGLLAVKAAGGLAVVQDPADAIFPGMPRGARDTAEADHAVPAADLGRLLGRLTRDPVPQPGGTLMPAEGTAMPSEALINERMQKDIAEQGADRRADGDSIYVCPECGGHLWQVHAGRAVRFHCHVGHAWSLDSMLAQKSEELEAALWRCVRLLTEKATMTRQGAARAREAGRTEVADRIEEMARLDDQHVRLIRDLLLEVSPNPTSQTLRVEELLHETDLPPQDPGGRPSTA